MTPTRRLSPSLLQTRSKNSPSLSVLEKFPRMIPLKAGRLFNSNHQNTPETMNTITAPLILLAWAAIAAPLHAAPPLPATSSVQLRMTESLKVGEKPVKMKKTENFSGHQCYGDTTTYSLEPVFTRGMDATSSNLILSIYIIGSGTVSPSTEKKSELFISKPFSQIISNTNTSLVKDSSYSSLKWRCGGECSRRHSRPAPEWYAEVTQDGKILCSTQSKSNSEIKKLIETRKVLSEGELKALPVPTKSN